MKTILVITLLLSGGFVMNTWLLQDAVSTLDPVLDEKSVKGVKTAVLAGGCFWCTESLFKSLDGVIQVTSGYAGGTADTAEYNEVSSGATGHAECIQITYTPSIITYGKLLEVFFTVAHDPTQLDRQGPDRGKQYRSAVFYSDDEQKRIIEAYIAQLSEAEYYTKPIVTTVEPLEKFYLAEEYHQDYADRNPVNPYILFNSLPKNKKLEKSYPELLKKE